MAFVLSNRSPVCLHVLVQDAWSHSLLNCEDMIKYQVIDLPFKCLCHVYCGVCNVPHDRPTFTISTLITLQDIHGSGWPNGLGNCHSRRSWVPVPHWYILCLLGNLLCKSQFMSCKFNCNTLGWKLCSFFYHTLLKILPGAGRTRDGNSCLMFMSLSSACEG